MKRLQLLPVLLYCLLFLFSCSLAIVNDKEVKDDIYSEAVFNKKLSSLYCLNGKRVQKIDEKTYSHYDLNTLPDAKILTDNWLICEDGSAYRLDVDTYFREDYCTQLYQIYWKEASADRILELYATDTVLKNEPVSGKILCTVKDGEIASYIFLETCNYSDYQELISSGYDIYTCDYYPQIGEMHLVKTDFFESNEEIVNEIGKNEDIKFIRHQIWPDSGYWSMTGIYVFTGSGSVYSIFNGEILEKNDSIIDISFKYGNYAGVTKDREIVSNRSIQSALWTDVRKIIVSELPENNLGLTYKGDMIYTASNVYSDVLSGWKDVRDIAVMTYEGVSYPLALTNSGSVLFTADNPFADKMSDFVSVEEFCISERESDFAIFFLTYDGTLLICR